MAGGGRAVASGSGCIGYAGDIDIFRLVGGNPCAVATSSTGMGDCGLQLTFDRPGGNLDIAYFLTNFGAGTVASFLVSAEGPMETVFGDGACGGDAECILYEAGGNEDYLLIVRDFGQDNWSLNQANCYNWTLTSAPAFGCPVGCNMPHPVSGNCQCP